MCVLTPIACFQSTEANFSTICSEKESSTRIEVGSTLRNYFAPWNIFTGSMLYIGTRDVVDSLCHCF